jgi:hypothetical protein
MRYTDSKLMNAFLDALRQITETAGAMQEAARKVEEASAALLVAFEKDLEARPRAEAGAPGEAPPAAAKKAPAGEAAPQVAPEPFVAEEDAVEDFALACALRPDKGFDPRLDTVVRRYPLTASEPPTPQGLREQIKALMNATVALHPAEGPEAVKRALDTVAAGALRDVPDWALGELRSVLVFLNVNLRAELAAP